MAERFSVLLVDDGELDDVRSLLGELGLEFAHLRGGGIPKRVEPPRDLFLTTLRHAALARAWPQSADGLLRPVRIAFVDEDSPTARQSLRRLGFAYLVRRPVHPVALRLLLLRALYLGDERRDDVRVPVGVDVSLRTGLRRRDALLADLSRGGCRLVTDRALPAGARITLHLPRELVGDAELALSGQILRCERDAHALADGGFQVAVRFREPKGEASDRLARFLARRDVRLGPAGETTVAPLRPADEPAATAARLRPAPAPPAPRSTRDGVTRIDRVPTAPGRPEADPAETTQTLVAPARADASARVQTPPAPAPPAASAASLPPAARTGAAPAVPRGPQTAGGAPPPRLGASLIRRAGERRGGRPPERRRHDRRRYDRRVLAAASAAMHRMLFGRDLSAGGMRVDRHPELRVGARLRLALYDATREQPLVVDAVVARDDGPRGFGLQFLAVAPELATRLEQLVATLPPVEPLTDGEAGALGSVVGEILS
jgi:hypothetical protein